MRCGVRETTKILSMLLEWGTISVLMLSLSTIVTDCASTHPRLLRETLDPTQQLVYVKDDNTLCLTDGQGSHTQELLKIGASITSPVWSPNGRYIAFFSFGQHLGPFKFFGRINPFSAQEQMKLILYDVTQRTHQVFDDFDDFHLPLKNVGPAGIELPIFPPRWAPNGQTLFLTDGKGIYRVSLTEDTTQPVTSEQHARSIVYGDGFSLLYADSNNYILTTRASEQSLAPATLRLITDKETSVFTFAPDGSHVAVGQWNRVIIQSLTTQESIEIHKASDPIEWMAWLPHDNRLVCLSGRPHRRIGGIGMEYGYYSLFSLSSSGSDIVELYKGVDIDVRECSPDLSLDGRYIALIGKPLRDSQKVYIVATDGSGWIQLIRQGQCSWPAWQPRGDVSDPR